MTSQPVRIILCIVLLNSLIGCSNNGDPILEGTFIDSAVEGVEYATGSLRGRTDIKGTFFYREGETVDFSIGHLNLGSAVGAPMLSPIDLADTSTPTGLHQFWNTLILLQSLDQDADPENGISILPDISTRIGNYSIDLTQPPNQFIADPEPLSFIRTMTSQTALVDPEDAIDHFSASLFSNNIGLPSQTVNVYADLNLNQSAEVPYELGIVIYTYGTSIGAVQAGNKNAYPSETLEITLIDGTKLKVITADNDSAETIAASLDALPEVSATALTYVFLSDIQDTGGTIPLQIFLNNQLIATSTGADSITPEVIANNINNFEGVELRNIEAVLRNTADSVVITSTTGEDLTISINSTGSSGDAVTIVGYPKEGSLTLSSGAGVLEATVGGFINIEMESIGYETRSRISSNGESLLLGGTGDAQPFIENLFVPQLEDTFNYSSNISIYDSLGNQHTLELYFVKDYEPGLWTLYLLVNGRDIGEPNPALPSPDDIAPNLAAYRLYFTADGTLDETKSDPVHISYWNPTDENGEPTGALQGQTYANGATFPISGTRVSSNFEIDVSQTTQSDADFEVRGLWQNGWGWVR